MLHNWSCLVGLRYKLSHCQSKIFLQGRLKLIPGKLAGPGVHIELWLLYIAIAGV